MGSKWDKLSRNLMEPTSEADIKRLEEYEEEGRLAGRLSKMPDLSQLSKFGTEVQEWHYEWLAQAFRVLQPGGIIKAFSATRTYHRLAAAMEDAGFVDIRLESWTYGSGFPKSKNIALFLDKRAKAIENRGRAIPMASTHFPGEGKYSKDGEKLTSNIVGTYQPRTPEAEKWNGWGTALKPAWEPVVIGVKP
jgi:DNA modification methylase